MTLPAEEVEQQALAAYAAGDLQEAIQGFERARNAYRQQSDLAKSAELANSLSVALLQAGRPQEALQAVQGTVEVFADQGDRQREAMATGNLAAALEACGELPSAETHYRQAADLFRKSGDLEAERHTLTALSQLQLRQRRPLEAAATMGAARADRSLRSRLLGWLLQLQSKLLRS